MHRPGIASVSGEQVVLNGTSMNEVETVHMDTLRLVLEVTNRDRVALAERRAAERERERQQNEDHARSVGDIAKRLKFD